MPVILLCLVVFWPEGKWGNGALDISLLMSMLGRRRALRGQMESVVSIHKEYHCKLRDLRVFCTSRRASAICLYIFLRFAHREGHLRFAYIYSCVLHIEKSTVICLYISLHFCTWRGAPTIRCNLQLEESSCDLLIDHRDLHHCDGIVCFRISLWFL